MLMQVTGTVIKSNASSFCTQYNFLHFASKNNHSSEVKLELANYIIIIGGYLFYIPLAIFILTRIFNLPTVTCHCLPIVKELLYDCLGYMWAITSTDQC